MKNNYFKIRADAWLALVVAEAMEKTGLGQSDVLRLGSLRGVARNHLGAAGRNRPAPAPGGGIAPAYPKHSGSAPVVAAGTAALRRKGRK